VTDDADDFKKSRRDQIEERQKARMDRIKNGFATYWCTRSTRDGVLTDYVDVWLARPHRVRLIDDGSLDDDGIDRRNDVFWMATFPNGDSAHYGRWTLAQAHMEVRNGIPQDDRQCLRSGHEPAIEVLVATSEAFVS